MKTAQEEVVVVEAQEEDEKAVESVKPNFFQSAYSLITSLPSLLYNGFKRAIEFIKEKLSSSRNYKRVPATPEHENENKTSDQPQETSSLSNNPSPENNTTIGIIPEDKQNKSKQL